MLRGVDLLPLSHAPAATDCVVVDVAGDGPLVARLRELGIEVGAPLRVVRPGRTLLLHLGDGRVALRAADAAGVRVHVAGPASAV
jgi:Fe2+ transport system protein FeoA